MKEKAVVLLSGGLDSVVLLNYLISLGLDVWALSFNYGQRHNKELNFAEYWGGFCYRSDVIDVPFFKLFSNTALLNDIALPKEHYTHENQKITVVPNRNLIFLSIAAGIVDSSSEEVKEIYFAAHSNDYTIYPDCRPDFVDKASQAIESATYKKIRVIAPFVHKNKSDLVAIGHSLKVDFTKTWSCYAGQTNHCGLCATCQERKEAFKMIGLEDVTRYDN